jgi:hypothetical protein
LCYRKNPITHWPGNAGACVIRKDSKAELVLQKPTGTHWLRLEPELALQEMKQIKKKKSKRRNQEEDNQEKEEIKKEDDRQEEELKKKTTNQEEMSSRI